MLRGIGDGDRIADNLWARFTENHGWCTPPITSFSRFLQRIVPPLGVLPPLSRL